MNTIQYITLVLAALLLTSSAALAQAEADGAQEQADNQREVQLTPEEMMIQADAMIAQMDEARGVIRSLLRTAPQQRDDVKVLCLDDKLKAVAGLLRAAQLHSNNLREALEEQDGDIARHQFAVLQRLHQKGSSLEADARQCLGVVQQIDTEDVANLTIDHNPSLFDPVLPPELGPIENRPPKFGMFTYTILFRNAQGQEKRIVISGTNQYR